MDRATLDAAYNNSAAVRNSAQIVADWQRRSDVLRRLAIEIRYGDAERNLIDVFEAGKPLLVFIHGGYCGGARRRTLHFSLRDPSRTA